MTTEAVPRWWAIPDPVLSDVPPRYRGDTHSVILQWPGEGNIAKMTTKHQFSQGNTAQRKGQRNN